MSTLSAKSATGLLLSLLVVKEPATILVAEAQVLALFDQYHGRLVRYSISFGLQLEDAQDVVQETFLSLFEHLRHGKPQENLPGWLFRVTHNLSIKRRAKRQNDFRPKSEDCDQEIESVDPSMTAEEQILLLERQHRLQSCLTALPELDRQCIALRAEGLRYREIASVLGISLGSVASHLARAFDRLQRSLP